MPIRPSEIQGNPSGSPDAIYPETEASEEASQPVKSVSLTNSLPEKERADHARGVLDNRRVEAAGSYTGDAIPDVQHNFRKALNQLNQTCSGLMLIQMMQLRRGLVGLPGLYYQPGGRPPIAIDAAGGNLPGNALKQLYQYENAFIQQPSRAFTALNRQLAATQYQVQATVNLLATIGLQAGMPQSQLTGLLPFVGQPQAIALGQFPGIYSGANPLAAPWLPKGFTASFDAAAAQQPVPFARYWVPGTPAMSAIPSGRGFYFMPEAPNENVVFQSPFSPYSAWRHWCENSDHQPLPILYPGLEYNEGLTENDEEATSIYKRSGEPRTKKPADDHEFLDSLDVLDDIGEQDADDARASCNVPLKSKKMRAFPDKTMYPKTAATPHGNHEASQEYDISSLNTLKKSMEEKKRLIKELGENILEMESQLQNVEERSLVSKEKVQENIKQLSNNESELQAIIQAVMDEVAENKSDLVTLSKKGTAPAAEVEQLFKQLSNEETAIEQLKSRVDVVNARLEEMRAQRQSDGEQSRQASSEKSKQPHETEDKADLRAGDQYSMTQGEESTASHSDKMKVGFPNYGNTCFANGALKAILGAYPDDYYAGLGQQVSRIEDEKRPILIAFLNLVDLVNSKDEKKVGDALKALFDACSNHEVKDKATGKVVSRLFWNIFNGEQQDAPEFILPLMNILGISDNPAFCLKQVEIKTFQSGNDLKFINRWENDGYISPLLNLPLVKGQNKSLQSILEHCSEEESLNDFEFKLDDYKDRRLEFIKGNKKELEKRMKLASRSTLMRGKELVTKRQLMFTADTKALTHIGIQVGMYNAFDLGVKLEDEAKELLKPENDYLELPVTDTESGEEELLKFRRKSMCFHSGQTAKSGHYSAAVKHEKDGQEQWQYHNDSSVSDIGHPSEEVSIGEPYMMFYERVWSDN